jgi:hypothetical protein
MDRVKTYLEENFEILLELETKILNKLNRTEVIEEEELTIKKEENEE